MSEASVTIFVSASDLGCVRSVTEAKACLVCVKAVLFTHPMVNPCNDHMMKSVEWSKVGGYQHSQE